jgi:hypothetical protein
MPPRTALRELRALGKISKEDTWIITPAEKLSERASKRGLKLRLSKPSRLPIAEDSPFCKVSNRAK